MAISAPRAKLALPTWFARYILICSLCVGCIDSVSSSEHAAAPAPAAVGLAMCRPLAMQRGRLHRLTVDFGYGTASDVTALASNEATF